MSAISNAAAFDSDSIPVSVAIIMDGNGRWAQNRGLTRSEGHIAGAACVPEVIRAFRDAGTRYLTLYAFSTENWKRPRAEIDGIMNLVYSYLCDRVIPELLADREIGVRFIGDPAPLPSKLREACAYANTLSQSRPYLCTVALNYGGRAEIVRAARIAAAEGKTDITERELSSLMYTGDTPDPDLIIRTGGEKRLSNFLLWQSAYSELLFTDVLWPDVRRHHIDEFIGEYRSRIRRIGGI